MSTIRKKTLITAALSIFTFLVILTACDSGQGMMHGNGANGMSNLNWVQIIAGFAIGIIIGYPFGMMTARKKKQ